MSYCFLNFLSRSSLLPCQIPRLSFWWAPFWHMFFGATNLQWTFKLVGSQTPWKVHTPTLQQIRQNRNDRYWSSSSKVTEQIGWRVVMFWHPGEYASALSQNSDVFQKRSLLANIIIWSCMYICHLFISSCCEGPLTPYECLPGLSRANVPIAFPLYQCSSLETSGRPGRVDGSFVSVRWDLLFATIFWWNFLARNLIELFRIRNVRTSLARCMMSSGKYKCLQ